MGGSSTVMQLHGFVLYCYNYYTCTCIIYAGLPQKEKNKLENIHYLCCSNRLNALELAEPLVDNLLELEQGVVLYDALLGKEVLIRVPVMLVIADNPMASEICNHQGSTAIRFCRMCLVSYCNHARTTIIIIHVRR